MKSIIRIVKCVVFAFIFVVLFSVLQHIVVPKYYYPDNTLPEAISRITSGFYYEGKNTIDCIIAGPSTSEYGVYPMELYNKYGYTSYNLSTSGQPMQVTYYLLKEALKYQSPKIFIMDISAIYYDETTSESAWRYVLDQMPISINKFQFAKDCIKYTTTQKSVLDILFPLLRYHDRWDKLVENDFTDFHRNMNLYSRGGYINSAQVQGKVDIETMNMQANAMSNDTVKFVLEYINNQCLLLQEDDNLYKYDINEKSIEWLLKIRDLCLQNNIFFLTFKVPTIGLPEKTNAWTIHKYNNIKSICEKNNINYIDMLYDLNVNLNLSSDTPDGGNHFNILGALKITNLLGKYLSENYDLPSHEIEIWNNDLCEYEKVKKVALLQTEQNLYNYLNVLANEYDDKMIFIAASDDMITGLSTDEKIALKNLGLKSEFSSDAFEQSYVAIIDNGNVYYEALSNRKINYKGRMENQKSNYEIISSGWYTSPEAKIIIDGMNYSMNYRGLNIVVYDDDRNMVIDSVCFDTYLKEHEVIRKRDNQLMQLSEFEHYVIEHEARR